MNNLTLSEQATNYQTYQHINTLMKLLAQMQFELIKRQFTHDRSKLASPEVTTFTEFTPKLRNSTYGSEEYKKFLADMKPALDHHYSHNRHHPEFFEEGIEGMNLIDVIEMFCDWYAASQRHNDGDINKSIQINQERFGISPQLVKILQNSIELFESDIFKELKTQKDI